MYLSKRKFVIRHAGIQIQSHLLAVLIHLAHTAVKWKTNVDDFIK